MERAFWEAGKASLPGAESSGVREQQLQAWWARRRGRPLPAETLQEIYRWAQEARRRLDSHGSLESCLEAAGIQLELSQQPHRIAGVRMRARLDLGSRRLTLFAGALDELGELCPDRPLLIRVILAHEAFHLLCPQCPGAVQEAAAHWFAALLCDLPDFPGGWDLLTE